MSKLKYKNTRLIESSDWDQLVSETYGRIYCFQQQDGCKDRGIFNITIPEKLDDDQMPDTIPEVVNGNKMGVKFSAWLARNPKEPIKQFNDHQLDLFWRRNFYPNVQMIANDLHEKGIIEAGGYTIIIDW